MTTVVKTKIGINVPTSIQRKAGFRAGDVVEFKASGGVITILPKLPNADDEYTPEQRRIIDAQLNEASKGPHYGPFESIEELERSMRKTGKRARNKSKPAARK